jgi:aryl-alcohol dehydrogenase-like predicted oxidoreductase
VSTRRLGNSDLNITPVGFGAWAIGGTGYDFAWGKQDDADSIAAIHRSLELGVNWIDTAPVYGTGHSEEIVASALKEWRGSRPYVFTKCVMRWDEKGRVIAVFNRDSIRRECADSLRRLQVDVIDLYQMHWPPADNGPGLEEAWQTMAGLQKEGKVRWIGVSNFTVAQIERAEKIAPVISLQPPYSLIHRQIETETLPYCEKQGIGVIVYSPMASGLLTGAMTRERAAKLPDDDWRKHSPEFREPISEGSRDTDSNSAGEALRFITLAAPLRLRAQAMPRLSPVITPPRRICRVTIRRCLTVARAIPRAMSTQSADTPTTCN